jgi:hypothetical protein
MIQSDIKQIELFYNECFKQDGFPEFNTISHSEMEVLFYSGEFSRWKIRNAKQIAKESFLEMCNSIGDKIKPIFL